MMGRFVFLALFGMLCFFSTSISSHFERLMDNVVVLRVRSIDGSKETVRISCIEDYQDQLVTWKKNGVLQPELQGNHISVTVLEWGGGYYSCHHGPDGPQLNFTMVMVQLEPDNRTTILEHRGSENDYIHCSTPNYSGAFHCRWSKSLDRSDASVLLVKGHRNQETVTCEVDSSGSGMRCMDNNCPYKEEQHRISLTLYMNSVFRLEAYTKAFYLRDIVTPGRLPNLHLTDGSVFKWDYPETWEKPCSFFSLQFQVKAVYFEETCNSENYIMVNNASQTEYRFERARKYVFCVRAQDKHTGGPWGPWSHCIVKSGICQPQ